MQASVELDPQLLSVLAAVVDTCHHALADYRAGLIDDDELRDEVVATGQLTRLRDAIDGLSAGGTA
jgi:hypothetical protein